MRNRIEENKKIEKIRKEIKTIKTEKTIKNKEKESLGAIIMKLEIHMIKYNVKEIEIKTKQEKNEETYLIELNKI